MKRLIWGPFILLLVCMRASAAPACISGNSLASYEALGPEGCNVGPLAVKDFVFLVGPSGGGGIPISATDITVTTQFLSAS